MSYHEYNSLFCSLNGFFGDVDDLLTVSRFLAHETAHTYRKSSSRSFDPGRRSSTGYSCAPL